MWLLLKNLLFTLIVPGTMAVLLPYLLLGPRTPSRPPSWGAAQFAAVPVALVGLSIYVACVWEFARRGRATPAPVDAPRVLVVQGLYRYVRNPMYLGVLLFILAQAIFHVSGVLGLYAAAFLLVVHLFTVLYEEPALQRQFGGSYDTYRRSVRRWVPGRPFRPGN
jgi:protein-S-isoprenylcysteine O-methyltransferase Ste14